MSRIPSPGALFAGRYRVESVLGTGGMGVVLSVFDERTSVSCALKLLSAPELRGDAARLIREARALMLISSPHVVRIFDVDEVEGMGPYLVLEKLNGSDLGELCPLGTPVHPSVVARYAIEVTDALAHAHAVGIIHRDIKPSNLFLADLPHGGSVVKVLDFGISKVGPGDGLGSLTKPDSPLGSPQFISPEQLKNPREVDVRTDLWSLGVVMFRLISGTIPFDGATVAEIFGCILRGERPRLLDVAPSTPPELAAIVESCLALDPAERPATARDLQRMLRAFADDVLAPLEDMPTVAVGGATLALRSPETTAPLPPAPLPPALIEATGRPLPSEPDLTTVAMPARSPDPRREDANRGERARELSRSEREPKRREEPTPIPTPPVFVSSRTRRSRASLVAVLVGFAIPVALLLAFRSNLFKGIDSPVAVTAEPPPLASTADPSAVELSVEADEPIESLVAPGMRTLALDGARAVVVVAPWSGALPIEARLRSGGRATGSAASGGTNKVRVAKVVSRVADASPASSPVAAATPPPSPSPRAAAVVPGRRVVHRPGSPPAPIPGPHPPATPPKEPEPTGPIPSGLRDNPYR